MSEGKHARPTIFLRQGAGSEPVCVARGHDMRRTSRAPQRFRLRRSRQAIE